MSDFTKFILQAFLRKALTALGAFLITHGMMADSTADSFAAKYLEPVAGAVLIGGSALWTWGYQQYVKRKVKKALQMPEGTTPGQLEKALEKSG